MRLTKAIKEEIFRNALAKAGLTEAQQTLQEDNYAFAEEVRLVALGGLVNARESETFIGQVRKGISDRKLYAQLVYVRSGIVAFQVGGQRRRLDLKEPKVRAEELKVLGDHPLALKLDSLDQRKQELEKTREDLVALVWPVISGATTVANLIKLWPEAEELLPELTASPKSCLPAVQISDINRALGLPSEGNP